MMEMNFDGEELRLDIRKCNMFDLRSIFSLISLPYHVFVCMMVHFSLSFQFIVGRLWLYQGGPTWGFEAKSYGSNAPDGGQRDGLQRVLMCAVFKSTKEMILLLGETFLV